MAVEEEPAVCYRCSQVVAGGLLRGREGGTDGRRERGKRRERGTKRRELQYGRGERGTNRE